MTRAMMLPVLLALASLQYAANAASSRDWLIKASSIEEARQKTLAGMAPKKQAASPLALAPTLSPASTEKEWFEDYKAYYNKKYPSQKAEQTAFKHFLAAIKGVRDVNLDPGSTWWASINELSDKDPQDLLKALTTDPKHMAAGKEQIKRSLRELDLSSEDAVHADNSTLPASHRRMLLPGRVDWVGAGKVSAVKYQGACGSCWAYSSTTAIESAYLISQGLKASQVPRPFLSVQQIIDCANSKYGYMSQGCSYGYTTDGFIYASKKALSLESVYADRGNPGSCTSGKVGAKGKSVQMKADGWYVKGNSESALRQAVAKQPVVIYFAVGSSFFSYAGGIYHGSGPSAVNHAMVAYGYQWNGKSSNSYFMLQNSWGTGWGEGGRARVRMAGEKSKGVCLMYTFGAAPTKSFSKTISKSTLQRVAKGRRLQEMASSRRLLLASPGTTQ